MKSVTETSTIMTLSEALEGYEPTVMIGTPECTKTIQVQYLCAHARTMCMMYEATGEQRYLKQARIDLDTAHAIKLGFQRPLGVHIKEVA